MQKIIFTLLLIFIAGCSTMNSSFDCPNKPGVMCQSLDQVNTMVDRGEFSRSGSVTKDVTSIPMDTNKVYTATNTPLRTGEQVLRIWIAPYQDAQNNYHDEGALYAVVRPSQWQVPNEIKE